MPNADEKAIPKCPFCGGTAVLDSMPRHFSGPDRTAFFYRCNSCAAQGGWAKTEGNALKLWSWRFGVDNEKSSKRRTGS